MSPTTEGKSSPDRLEPALEAGPAFSGPGGDGVPLDDIEDGGCRRAGEGVAGERPVVVLVEALDVASAVDEDRRDLRHPAAEGLAQQVVAPANAL